MDKSTRMGRCALVSLGMQTERGKDRQGGRDAGLTDTWTTRPKLHPLPPEALAALASTLLFCGFGGPRGGDKMRWRTQVRVRVWMCVCVFPSCVALLERDLKS